MLVFRIICLETQACTLSKPAKIKKNFFWHPSQIWRAMQGGKNANIMKSIGCS